MHTVITYGTFDLLHYGHLELLRRASDYGHKLIVGVSTDQFNRLKNKTSVIDYGRRKWMVEAFSFVDLVIPEYSWDQKIHDIQKYNVNTFVMGDDWYGKFDDLKPYCDVVYLPRTRHISTTVLKSALHQGQR